MSEPAINTGPTIGEPAQASPPSGVVGEPARGGEPGEFSPSPLGPVIAIGPDGKRYQLTGEVTLTLQPSPIET